MVTASFYGKLTWEKTVTNDPLVIAWAAGIVEGEGHISTYDNKVRVVVEMTDLDILERLQNNFGGSLVQQKRRKEAWKISWRWSLTSSAKAKEFLILIYPLLGNRRQAKCQEAFSVVTNTRSVKKQQLLNRVYSLRDQGLTHRAIADSVGYDRSYVSHILRKRNVSTN
jgi:hypothetical protein